MTDLGANMATVASVWLILVAVAFLIQGFIWVAIVLWAVGLVLSVLAYSHTEDRRER